MQPVFDQFKAMTYMGAYPSKTAEGYSQEMKDALQDAIESNKITYEQMKAITHMYINKRNSAYPQGKFCSISAAFVISHPS